MDARAALGDIPRLANASTLGFTSDFFQKNQRPVLVTVLMAADGVAMRVIAREVNCAIGTAAKWRVRYVNDRAIEPCD
jgi:hypothetical protein